MKKNSKLTVKSSAPFHANKTGYFQFKGNNESEGIVALSQEPDDSSKVMKLFFVRREFVNMTCELCVTAEAVDVRFDPSGANESGDHPSMEVCTRCAVWLDNVAAQEELALYEHNRPEQW